MTRSFVGLLGGSLMLVAAVATAQDFRGRIGGKISDNTGAVLPGVTITATSPALIQPHVQVSGADGGYRFVALPPGLYDLSFELSGFRPYSRHDIRVVINQTLTVDVQMSLASLQETVTVSGASPIVDTSTTTLGTNFTKELLTEIPNARDIWAAMSQAPGLQMTSYDVGGSHTGTQTGYRTYGFDDQNQTKLEGIDTTESTSANAGYFDFGSFEEFQVGGAGNGADGYAPGANLSISVKSGGDRFSGRWYSDWEGDATITDNVPDNLRVSRQKDESGFFVRSPLRRGNPIDRQYDINGNVGGPLWKGKAWFFYSYRLNDQYKTILGFDELARSKLSNKYTFKGTFQLGRSNQIIGFLNKREKLQNKRGIGPTQPLSAARFQSSRNYPMKIEWTSVIGNRAFLDVLAAQWYNFFPLRPTIEAGLYDGPWGPGRQDLATGNYFDGGANNSYQDQKRFKPQFYVSLSYFKEGWRGSHDFKFGYDWKRDRRSLFNDQPFDIFYRDRNGATSELELYNTPVTGINDVEYNAAYVSDTWTLGDRLTLNLGGRLEHYRDGWPEQDFRPNGHAVLADWSNPAYRAFVSPQTVQAKDVARTTTFAPRAGLAYDLSGDNRTVLKVFWGMFRFNSADTLADQENPVGRARLRYQFRDLNGNRLLDGPGELGRLLTTVGGGGFVHVDPDITRPFGTELSTNVEREVFQGLSARASYVYKNIRNDWAEYDPLRAPSYTVPYEIDDPGPDNTAGTGDDQTFQSFDRPAGAAQDRIFTNPDGNDADFHTVEFALNRRLSNRWMLLTSFGHTWSKMLHDTTGFGRFYSFRPARQLFGDEFGREISTFWNYKVIGRYVLPLDVGLSGSWKFQSGQNYGRTISERFPGDGTQTVRVEPIDTNRYPNVSILDFRLDKTISTGRFGRLTGMLDVFNVLNDAVATSFRTTTVNYREVTVILDPRVVRFGIRFDF